MPTSKDAPPPPSEKTTTEAPASPEPAEPNSPPPGFLAPGVYEYTAPHTTVYAVPLTARPAAGDTPATVFDWFTGCPDDGRWTTTRKKPNQQPDNMPADTQGE